VGTQAHPTLPPVGGQQLLGGLREPLAVGGAPLLALGICELRTSGHDGLLAAEVTLSEVHAALEALDALPSPDSQVTLTGVLKRHGQR
jgi:hypothetical protein